jgi:hypothetical protein
MARVIIVISTVSLILVGASAGSGSLRGTLKTANSSGLVASADVQKEDNVKLSWAPWPCPKKGPWPAPPLCGEGRIELEYDVNQSEFEQRENNVKSSWAPWPCPKKGPWPAPPLCDEGGVELQDLVNQSADVQKEDNVKLSLPSIKGAAKKVAQGVKNAAKKVAQGKACVDASVKAGIKVGGKICVR